jgi:phosphatidylglycerophosphatase A
VPVYLLAIQGGRAGVGAVALFITLVGVWASWRVSRELQRKDPQEVVIDEVAGMLVTMLPVPHASFRAVLVGFAVFRLFDVVKPWPVRELEKLPAGWGIVLDDVAAGLMGAGWMKLLSSIGAI